VDVMIILLTLIAIVVAGVPLAAIVLVTVASRREEAARSIAGRAPGPLARAARRVLAFHTTGIRPPACRVGPRGQDRRPADPAEGEPAAAGSLPPGGERPEGEPVPAGSLPPGGERREGELAPAGGHWRGAAGHGTGPAGLR
jgi:hypothetical protein